MSVTPKRTIILNAIKAGGATKESLMAVAEVNAKGLASQFSYLRLTGNCPMIDDKEAGTFKIVTGEEWETYRAENKGAPKTPANPKTLYERSQKAHTAAIGAAEKAVKAVEAEPKDKLKGLINDAAAINVKIAFIKERNAQTAFNTAVADGWKEPVKEERKAPEAPEAVDPVDPAGLASGKKESQVGTPEKGKRGSFK